MAINQIIKMYEMLYNTWIVLSLSVEKVEKYLHIIIGNCIDSIELVPIVGRKKYIF